MASKKAKQNQIVNNKTEPSLKTIINNLWATPDIGAAGRENFPKWRNRLVMGLTFLTIFAIYFLTSAPTIVTEGDAAEFVAAGKIAGVAHPPGYPCFILLCWLVSKVVPTLSLARALNICSAISGALACTFLGAVILTITRRWAEKTKPFPGYFAATATALAAAMSLETWTQSISCEVYALSLAITFGAILLSIHEIGEKYPQIMLFVLAFGYGIHHTIIVLSIPIIAEFFFRTRLNLKGRWLETALVFGSIPLFFFVKSHLAISQLEMGGRIVLLLVVLVLMALISLLFKKQGGYKGSYKEIISCWGAWIFGLAFYLYLPIRSAADPNMDFVNPETYRGFWDLVTMSGMPSLNPASRDWAMWQAQFGSFFHQWFRQYPAWLFPFIWSGLLLLPASPFLLHGKKDWLMPGPWTLHMVLLAIFLGTTWGYITITNFAVGSSFENEVRVFYLPGYAVGAMGCGFIILFICRLSEKVLLGKKQLLTIWLASFLWLLGAGLWFGQNWHGQDKSQNYIAYNYGLDLLTSLPPNALIFTPGDNAAQPIFYFQQVEKRHLDIAAVHIPLIPFPWYQDMLKRIYPDLLVPQNSRTVYDIVRANIDKRQIFVARYMDNRQIPGYHLEPAAGFLYQVVKNGTTANGPILPLDRYTRLLHYPEIAMDLREQSMFAEYRDGFMKQGLFLTEHGKKDEGLAYLEFAMKMPPVEFIGDKQVRAYTALILSQTYYRGGKQLEAIILAKDFLQEQPDFTPLKQWLSRIQH